MDCSGPHIGHDYAAIFNTSVSQRGCLGVLPGTIEGSLGPAELLMQTLQSTALQLFQGGVSLLHKGESSLDIGLHIEDPQIHSQRICFSDGTILDGKLAVGDLIFGCSLKRLLPGQLVDLAMNEPGIAYLENLPIRVTHLGDKRAILADVRQPQM